MATPELPYPYHPDAWQEICSLGDVALVDVKPNEGDDFIAGIWVHSPYGFACRLERPFVNPDPDTVNTFWFEKTDAGPRRFKHEGVPFILDGLRQPVAHNPRKNGKFLFTQTQGLLGEPEGKQPELYLQTIGRVEDVNDPEQRIAGFENLLKTMLRAATSRQNPVPLPNYNKR